MEIKRMGPRRLRVWLTREDLAGMQLDYEALDCADPRTRGMFLSLLETARLAAGFVPRAQVCVEVFPDEAGGCVVWLSDLGSPRAKRWRVRRPVRSPVIYAFDDVDTLISGAVKLFRRCSHRIRKSALYRAGKQWRLMVYPLDTVGNITLPFLDEYAERCGEGPLAAAWLDEHGELLVAQDAVDLLSAYFG